MIYRGASPRRPPLHALSRGLLAPLRSRGLLAVARSLLSFGGTTRARERSAGRPRLAGGGVRVDERDDVPFVDAGHDGAALGAVDDLDIAAIEVLADLQEDEGLAVLLEHRLARHLDGVLDLAALDHDAQRRSGAHLRVGLLELEIDVELA